MTGRYLMNSSNSSHKEEMGRPRPEAERWVAMVTNNFA